MNSSPNKVALVTGAGTGIGKAAAKALLHGGFRVVLTGRNIEKLNKAKLSLVPPVVRSFSDTPS